MTARSVENQTKVGELFVITLPVKVCAYTPLVTRAFVYWEDEDAGTIVPISAIKSKNPVTGMITKVKSGGGGEYIHCTWLVM